MEAQPHNLGVVADGALVSYDLVTFYIMR